MFLIANCSLLALQVWYQFILDLAQDPPKCGNQEKMEAFLKSTISLVPKGCHIIRGSQILWALFSVKSQN